MSTPEARAVIEDGRAAAALILAVAEERDDDIAVILGCDPAHDRLAGIAYKLARLVVLVTRSHSDLEPGDVAQAVFEVETAHELRNQP